MQTVMDTEAASLWRYWREPIFSVRWWRGRALTLGVGGLLLVVAIGAALAATSGSPMFGMRVGAYLLIFWGLVIIVGPAAATWVQGHRWSAASRNAGFLAALMLGWGLSLAVEPGLMALSRAVFPSPPGTISVTAVVQGKLDGESSAEPPSGEHRSAIDARDFAPSPTVYKFALMFWLGGGFALLGYFPQQRRLAEAQRRRELAAAQAARREAELKLSVLAAQVEPHFLFNTLAGVRGAVASDPARAVTLIDRLADYLRLTIPRLRADGEAQGATLGRQLEIVEAYLALIHARLPRLAVSVQVPPELAGARFPPLMLISLAENAVKHGIEPKVGAARIEVAAQRAGEALAVSVCDDGVGFTGSGGGSGLGLANIRERLAQLYGARAALTLTAREAGGVCATISVPYEPVADADRDPR